MNSELVRIKYDHDDDMILPVSTVLAVILLQCLRVGVGAQTNKVETTTQRFVWWHPIVETITNTGATTNKVDIKIQWFVRWNPIVETSTATGATADKVDTTTQRRHPIVETSTTTGATTNTIDTTTQVLTTVPTTQLPAKKKVFKNSIIVITVTVITFLTLMLFAIVAYLKGYLSGSNQRQQKVDVSIHFRS